jgi:hypothetical protein
VTLEGGIERGNLAVSGEGSKLGQAKDRGIGRKAEKSVLSQPQSPTVSCGREQQKGEEARFPAMEASAPPRMEQSMRPIERRKPDVKGSEALRYLPPGES